MGIDLFTEVADSSKRKTFPKCQAVCSFTLLFPHTPLHLRVFLLVALVSVQIIFFFLVQSFYKSLKCWGWLSQEGRAAALMHAGGRPWMLCPQVILLWYSSRTSHHTLMHSKQRNKSWFYNSASVDLLLFCDRR